MISKSEGFKEEYCASIVRVEKVTPIPDSDFLGQTWINGISIVVRKDEVKEGDIMIYASNETMISEEFLAYNNIFDIEACEKNLNYPEVKKLLDEDRKEEAKRLVGYFNKYGRVKMKRLRGVPSYGVLFGQDAFKGFSKEFSEASLEDLVGQDFDTIGGKLWIQVFIPPVKEYKRSDKKRSWQEKKEKRFKRILPDEFKFHYDTTQLSKVIQWIPSDAIVDISVKMHGTSNIDGNVLVMKRRYLGPIRKAINRHFQKVGRPDKVIPSITTGYDLIYSSRKVIQNPYEEKKAKSGYYKVNVYEHCANLLKGLIPKGWTIYSEIVGYLPGAPDKYIQKDYDYGCKPGTCQMIPYRITKGQEEMNVQEVLKWTKDLLEKHPDLKEHIRPLPVLYHGPLKDLYPEVQEGTSHKDYMMEILKALKGDSERFGMELREPFCKNKVPREGIVLRIQDDPLKEAFKLKTDKFFERESKNMTNGVFDMEISETLEEE